MTSFREKLRTDARTYVRTHIDEFKGPTSRVGGSNNLQSRWVQQPPESVGPKKNLIAESEPFLTVVLDGFYMQFLACRTARQKLHVETVQGR